MNCRFLIVAAMVLGVCSNIFAQANFEITEVYAGLSGADGTEDWIEVTNFGDMAGDTGSLFYDDSSADPTVGANLTPFVLAPGESAIFLIGDDVADVDAFNMVWNGVSNVGLTGGGGAISQNGENGIFLFDSDLMGANIIDSVILPSGFGNFLLDTEMDGTQVYSTVQFNPGGGAFASSTNLGLSNTFFNDTLGASNDTVRLAGNPGFAVVPEPASAILLCGLTLGFVRRRR